MPPYDGLQSNGIDVSRRHGVGNYRMLSPFYHSEDNKIPVPGEEQTRADSVEGIWQGQKVISGTTDRTLFSDKPGKRREHPEGHQYGSGVLKYRKARHMIYVPAYLYHVINNALDGVSEDLEQRLQQGDVVMHDVENNGSINDTTKPYSHAALLVDALNVLKDAPLPPFSHVRFENLDQQLESALAFRQGLKGFQRRILDDRISFAYLFSPNEL
jgi:hypothetical protein